MKKKSKITASSLRSAFLEIIWPRRAYLGLGLVIIMVNRLAGLVLPGSTKYLVDEVFSKGDLKVLNWIVLGVGTAVSLQAVTSFSLTRVLTVEAQHLISRLRSKLQNHIVHLPISFFHTHKSGELVSRIMSDVEGIRNLVGTGLVQMLGGILTGVFSFVLLLRINVTMTLIAMFFLILFAVISLIAFSRIRPIFRKRREINAEVMGRLTEALNGIRVIKGFNADDREEKIFAKGVNKLFENIKKSMTATSLVTSAAILLMGLVSILIYLYGGRQIVGGNMTSGDFIAFMLYLGFLVAPIVQMSNIGSQITEAFAGLDRMNEILKEKREDQEENHRLPLLKMKGEVEFRNVSFTYSEERKDVLKSISLKAGSGSVTALVGTSGSGKSTLASLVASFLSPTSGEVLIDNRDLKEIRLSDYRKHLGVVFQDDFLYDGSIRENILYGRPDASEAELKKAVRGANVDRFTKGFEQGLDTIIGERGVMLSGGQRQRVSIARALLADPKILILDEATSNLDTESERLIQESLTTLMKDRTTFVIAHRLSTIRNADQILVIENGEIVERGKHDRLINSKGRYYELYTYQAHI